jgi:hypothetical protein
VIFILQCVVAVGEGSSRPSVLLGGPPLLLLDVLLATRGGLET